MSGSNENIGTPHPERRQRQDLRLIFDHVLTLVTPFFQENGDAQEYWAAQAVREAYPELDEQGRLIVLAAAVRVSRERVTAGKR